MPNTVIVIPIYKHQLSEIEILSLKQCFKILGNYPVVFVCSKLLDITFYKNFLESINCKATFKVFPDKYFKNVKSYSNLLLNKNFYKQFINYEFMLIYQLDAWVFEDKLDYWCNQNYDYIGAPWFDGYDFADSKSKLLPVAGNGGFSLRKISSIIKVLSKNYRESKSFKCIYQQSPKRKKISKIINIPIYLYEFIFQKDNYLPLWYTTELYEDIVFVRYGQKAYKDFRLAPPEVALQFSFEAQPERLYQMNSCQLPFGCHAFEKYDFNFWKQFIAEEKIK